MYPRPHGSPEPTWRASCQMGSGDPRGLGYTKQPPAYILIFKSINYLQWRISFLNLSVIASTCKNFSMSKSKLICFSKRCSRNLLQVVPAGRRIPYGRFSESPLSKQEKQRDVNIYLKNLWRKGKCLWQQRSAVIIGVRHWIWDSCVIHVTHMIMETIWCYAGRVWCDVIDALSNIRFDSVGDLVVKISVDLVVAWSFKLKIRDDLTFDKEVFKWSSFRWCQFGCLSMVE